MRRARLQALYWAPRVLALGFAGFLSLFTLDAFEAGGGPMAILDWVIHMIPVLVVLASAAVAWRLPLLGAVVFAALGVVYLVVAWGIFPPVAYAAISGPLFLVALLFLLNWVYRDPIRASRGGARADAPRPS